MEGKIALEEHFSTAQNNQHWDAKGEQDRNGKAYAQDIERRLLDPTLCLADMDRAGIELSILSLTSPGVQSVADPKEATKLARSVNDYAHQLTRQHPGRFAAFAAVALQDPQGAATELERAVSELGLKGALINGYSNVGPNEQVQYLDEAPLEAFWATAARLNVPIYLHPREPLPSQRRALQGYPELIGSAWGFGQETASHAVRLMLSGIFDTHPNLQIVVGHLGEGLPYLLPRLQHRLDEQHAGEQGSRAKQRLSYYFAHNFYLTTSGHFHARQLQEAVDQIGPDRVLFSVDYPYEQMAAGARWFDDLGLADGLKAKLGRANANQLFDLGLPALPQSAAAAFGS